MALPLENNGGKFIIFSPYLRFKETVKQSGKELLAAGFDESSFKDMLDMVSLHLTLYYSKTFFCNNAPSQ